MHNNDERIERMNTILSLRDSVARPSLGGFCTTPQPNNVPHLTGPFYGKVFSAAAILTPGHRTPNQSLSIEPTRVVPDFKRCKRP